MTSYRQILIACVVLGIMICAAALSNANDCPRLKRIPRLKPFTGFLAGSMKLQDWLLQDNCPDGTCLPQTPRLTGDPALPSQTLEMNGQQLQMYTLRAPLKSRLGFPLFRRAVRAIAAHRVMTRRPAIFPRVRMWLFGG